MTPRQIELVQRTFAEVRIDADGAARIFYDKLFERQPSLRGMFADDMAEQRRRLMQMIGVAVAHLHCVETVLPALHALGRQHLDYGVRESHYDLVGAVLLETLAEAFGSDFTAEIRQAWTAAYVALADAMKAGARDTHARPSAAA